MRVAVIGQGYVGLPLTLALVDAGHTVVAVESDPDRAAALRRSTSYIADVSDESLSDALQTGRLTAVEDLAGQTASDVYLIAVPTPTTHDAEPDLQYLDAALQTAALTAAPGALIIVESTVYPGATRGYVVPRFEELSGLRAGIDVDVVYSPERIDPGRDDPYQDVPKIVGGLDDSAARAAVAFYETVFTKVITVASLEIAEFAKLFENIYRYINIAVVNELNQAAQAMDIDFRQVVAAASSKPYGFMAFSHGPGVGGHCLPNNVHYLNYALRKAGRPSTILAASAEVNDNLPEYVVDRIEGALRSSGLPLADSSVLILGLAYKPGLGDDRHSPSYAISAGLAARGARVKIADPHVPTTAVNDCFARVELSAQQCRDADIVVIATDHHDFDYNILLEHAALVLDCRGRLNSPRVEQL
jgi:UDP-N-acetyl-D-glucosamine dehydrogenase